MGIRHVLPAAIFVSFLPSVHAAVSSTGFTVSLTDTPYFLPPQDVATISLTEDLKTAFRNGPFVPFTVVNSITGGYSSAELSSVTAKYLVEDDVFQEGFLEGMLGLFGTAV